MKDTIKHIFFATALTLGCFGAFGQSKKTSSKTENTQKETGSKDNLNKTDHLGRKQGMWFYKHEAALGEPLTYEYGQYINNKKEGVWTTLDAEQLLVSTENFNKGVLNGTSQYYDKGRLVCIGTYRGLNQDRKFDSIMVKNPDTYADTLVWVPTEQGYTKHGIWRYYDAFTGQMTKEQEFQVDNVVYEKNFNPVMSKADSARMVENTNKFISNKKYAKHPPGKSKSLTE